MLHTHILTDEQKQLLPIIKLFRKNFYLVGGTALALQIGHRRSIDFDLFTYGKINHSYLKKILYANSKNFSIEFRYEDSEQMHLKINAVKITFFSFPYKVPAHVDFNGIIKIPSLIDLAAMKAFAFAERAKWKDYTDMYFLLKNYFSIKEISARTDELFNTQTHTVFTEKLFRQQLAFYKDINYSEPVEYIGNPVTENEIKKFLTEVSLTQF